MPSRKSAALLGKSSDASSPGRLQQRPQHDSAKRRSPIRRQRRLRPAAVETEGKVGQTGSAFRGDRACRERAVIAFGKPNLLRAHEAAGHRVDGTAHRIDPFATGTALHPRSAPSGPPAQRAAVRRLDIVLPRQHAVGLALCRQARSRLPTRSGGHWRKLIVVSMRIARAFRRRRVAPWRAGAIGTAGAVRRRRSRRRTDPCSRWRSLGKARDHLGRRDRRVDVRMIR